MSQYGMTFAQKLIQHGEFAAAVEEASRHAAREPDSPEPFHDRARALSALGRYEEAVADYARAIELDRVEQILHDGEVDDGLFSTIIAWCQSLSSQEEKLAVLSRYEQLLPGGAHRQDAAEWALRFRGQLPTTWSKPRD
ncbi:MAG: tetratricopeptide repeat protein [Myxococcales bacterium]|nr:tetratricopeptide repeat protein [Myxococcota bacterium]MDW8281460.1 tetratricopeptide repeat protein [Myxococcales bacterium]